MIIDGHTHFFPGKYLTSLESVGGEWTKKGIAETFKMAKRRPQSIDIDLRLEHLKKYSIDAQVVYQPSFDTSRCPGDILTQLAVARAVNNAMARTFEESKGKLIPAGTVPMGSIEQGGREEMERAIKELGLKALYLSSTINGKPLDLPEFEPFWAAVNKLDIPVFIHPYRPVGCTEHKYEADWDFPHNFGFLFETTLMMSRLVFSGIMDRYSNLKIVVHHLGGMIPFFWGRISETYEPSDQMRRIGKVMPRPLYDYFSRFYYDTAVGGSASAIKCAYEVFGADQIIFATDCPNGPDNGEGRLATYPDVIRSLGLSEVENRKIFEGNARKILRLN